jgi:hypothetical protein
MTRVSDKNCFKNRRTAGTVASSGVPKFAKITVTFGFGVADIDRFRYN